MRIVYLGTGDIGNPALTFLLESPNHEVVGVVTQPDRPVGRKMVMTPPTAKLLALEKGVSVEQPEKIRKDLDFLRAWDPEVIVVMAYGQILPQALLDLPSIACINLHASLLPRHRGASPIQAAIREGDPSSGITIMHIAKGLDTGDMIAKLSFNLAPDETGGSLHDRLAEAGPSLLRDVLGMLESGGCPREPQDEALTTYAPKLGREDGYIDWTLPAEAIERTIRAYDPWPGTSSCLLAPDGAKPRRVKIFPPVTIGETTDSSGTPGDIVESAEVLEVRAGCGKTIRISDLQPNGKRRMNAADFLRGTPISDGTKMGELVS